MIGTSRNWGAAKQYRNARLYLNRDGGFLDGEDQEIQGQSLRQDEDSNQYTSRANIELVIIWWEI